MKFGSHNTMTYRKPKHWWLYPVKYFAQCQRVDYKKQVEMYGAESFDLRIFWDAGGHIEFRHGLIAYDAYDIDEVLKYCEDEGISIRVLFEERNWRHLKKRSDEMNLKQKFIDFCEGLSKRYPKLICYGGRNSDTWELLYDFEYKPEVQDYYSSMTSLFNNTSKFLRVIDDWLPYLYAALKNKSNKKKFKDIDLGENTLVLCDFIDIG